MIQYDKAAGQFVCDFLERLPTTDTGKMCIRDRLKIRPDTTARNLPRKCKRCGQESIVNIEAPEPVSHETSA